MFHLLSYLGIGAAIMAFVILRTPCEKDASQMSKFWIREDIRNDTVLHENILIHFLLPLSCCLIIVVAWPAMLLLKAVDMWRFRRDHKPANAASGIQVLASSRSFPHF